MKRVKQEGGFTLVELTVALVIFSVVSLSIFALFNSLVRSTLIAKKRAVGLTLATNQMEYLKSLPYDSLGIVGGAFAGGTIPASKTQTVNGIKYTIVTSINPVDDAYDNCGPYPNTTLKLQYCRNSTTTTPTTDTNQQDYKIIHIKVTDKNNVKLAEVDTEIAARVAETASTTGALFVSVIDNNGNPIPDANVMVANSTISGYTPRSDTTDNNGIAIFYGLPPDNQTDYVITGTKTAYSTLYTINSFGSLQPIYPNQKILAQQSSFVTLVLKPQGVNSLVMEAVDTSGDPLSGIKLYIKGGYKKYTSATDTAYYYDNMTPSDNRNVTNASGLTSLENLVPGPYIFCGDDGATNCAIGSTKYYLAAAIPYGGTNSLNPIIVPTYEAASPPATTYPYNGQEYLQKVRLVFTSDANYPRVFTLSPDTVSTSASNLSSFAFSITGQKLSCGSSGSGCSSSVKFVQGSNTFVASCTGGTGGTQLDCTVNLTGLVSGTAQLIVGTNGGTLTLPATPLLGGLNVGS